MRINNIMCRYAQDDYTALIISQGAEYAGASVFSICRSNNEEYPFIVWIKLPPGITPGEVDAEIDKKRER